MTGTLPTTAAFQPSLHRFGVGGRGYRPGMSSKHGTESGDAPLADAALQAELAEAKRIGAWLYDHAPAGLRRHLGDVSEWPWLLNIPNAEDKPVPPPPPRDDPERDQAVLRTFAQLQAGGEDVYFAAEYVADVLHLSSAAFDAALANLIQHGLVEGGKTFQRSFVERVTDAGMDVAGMQPTHHDEAPGAP
jgi:hypothetical protein